VRRVPVHRLRAGLFPVVLAAIVIVADVVTTALAQRLVPARGTHVFGVVWLRLSYNSGVSFSLARNWPSVAEALALAALFVVTVLAFVARRGGPAWGFGLMMGGGFGNLIERFASSHRAVTDFVAVSSFPRFNLADAAVTVGFVIVLVTALRGRTLVIAK
jgi:signal peptidase II